MEMSFLPKEWDYPNRGFYGDLASLHTFYKTNVNVKKFMQKQSEHAKREAIKGTNYEKGVWPQY